MPMLTLYIGIHCNCYAMIEMQSYKNKILFYFLIILSGAGYYLLCYHTKRENFYLVFGLFSCLFYAYFHLIRTFSFYYFRQLVVMGILLRCLLLFSVPNLSDDVYRFIWDGRLTAIGINPFSHFPTEIMKMPVAPGITKELFLQLNSPEYYTVYPPVLQTVFWCSAKLFPENTFSAIVFLKCTIVLVEVGIYFTLVQILKRMSLSEHLSLLYMLNPLVIAELTGNVHFEGVIILLILLAFLYILKNKLQVSAIFLGCAIASKLVPLVFIPLFINEVGWKKGLVYFSVSGFISLFLFALFFDFVTIQHLLKSVDLFFRHFEFNASIYYFVRSVGTLLSGYNLIAWIGPILSATAILLILYFSFGNLKSQYRPFLSRALFAITIWYLFSTTIHPWYICLPVALTVFTPYRFAIIWSFTAILSYAAYQSDPVQENMLLVSAGYISMIVYGCWELKNANKFRILSVNDQLQSFISGRRS